MVTLEDTLALAERLHGAHPQRELVLRLIRNTGVRTRHIVLPLEETLRQPGFEQRNAIYGREARRRVPSVVEGALRKAGLRPADIDAIVWVSCTGFTMPSPTAWLINTMGFRFDTRQLPIAQLGCAAGAAAINRAHDFCRAHPGSSALIVACEFCSLCYQPDDHDVGSLLSDGLFGDAVAAAVVRGEGGTGVELEEDAAYLIPGTEEWISYAVKSTGFHFRLDRRVPGTMEPLAPVLDRVAGGHGWDAADLDVYIIHAGGPRILNDLARFLAIDPGTFRHSRATLTDYGNIASAVVLDGLRRVFADGGARSGARTMIAGFGPGITAEITLGTWTAPAGEGP
ncbi:type III polyketide synthase [Actinomadura fibrosa]|uniref:Type III polyketide synthase n=1 Tax=Actinomadura fibrosa TaxID=111802 RepID=A0ABW2XVN9_9ACTN|nr:type III polyketide synthase [Actinomadura fibrosa]